MAEPKNVSPEVDPRLRLHIEEEADASRSTAELAGRISGTSEETAALFGSALTIKFHDEPPVGSAPA
jgi:hypothetical protein